MDGTALIAEESKIPFWDGAKDYSGWPTGAPVREGEQVYTLLQPHNAAYCSGSTPANAPALRNITHTKDPARAKPWMPPSGTSGMYRTGEVYRATDGTVYRCKADNTVYTAAEYPRPGQWCPIRTPKGSVQNGQQSNRACQLPVVLGYGAGSAATCKAGDRSSSRYQGRESQKGVNSCLSYVRIKIN